MRAHRSRIPVGLLSVDAGPNAHTNALTPTDGGLARNCCPSTPEMRGAALVGSAGRYGPSPRRYRTHSIGELGVLKRDSAIDFSEGREAGVYYREHARSPYISY
jgi:hypothetical protein